MAELHSRTGLVKASASPISCSVAEQTYYEKPICFSSKFGSSDAYQLKEQADCRSGVWEEAKIDSAFCSRNSYLGLASAECFGANNGCSSSNGVSEPSSDGPKKSREWREANGEGVDVAEISAELQRERQKNAELMERITLLEAQLQEREKQEGSNSPTNRGFKNFKRQKIEIRNNEVEDAEVLKNTDPNTQTKHHALCTGPEPKEQHGSLVNWMSKDYIQHLNFQRPKDGDSAMEELGDTDDSDDDDCYKEYDNDIDGEYMEDDDSQIAGISEKRFVSKEEGVDVEPTTLSAKKELSRDKDERNLLPDARLCKVIENVANKREQMKSNRKRCKKVRRYKASSGVYCLGNEIEHSGSGSLLSYRKPPKVPFCPKEVRRIMESEVLLLKNAQSHTIRKIIVFASLGTRHGCDDMYELNFNYFSVQRKGEPYLSPKDPGEHVIYEHPGVQRKVFYPNQQNPVLCPVQILEEEKAMRPSDPSCPSCLFLCIKYGGRTRNLPQNEYVRQRMGRNKLKSFGPLICQMALLVHVRGGSFFFKALGVTLLFMAGFPDDLVQRETKYRNLDLLQKYYRTDEDAEGEELFHPYPMLYNTDAISNSRSLPVKGALAALKLCAKRQTALTNKHQNSQRPAILPSVSASPVSSQFGPMGITPMHIHPIPTFQSGQPHNPIDTLSTSNTSNSFRRPNASSHLGRFPPPFPIFPPYPVNTVVPMSIWHNSNAYPPLPYPSSYAYQSFPPSAKYVHSLQAFHSQPFYGCSLPQTTEDTMKKEQASEEADSDSDSSSSGTEQKKSVTSCL